MRAPVLLAALTLATLPALAQQSAPADPAAPATPGTESAAPGQDAAATGQDAAAGQGAAATGQGTSAAGQGTAAAGDQAAAVAPEGPLEFRTIIGDKPIEIPDDKLTEAFERFRETGTNPFAGDEAALAEGKALYARLCQACHLPQGEGRIGPSLRDDQWRHPRMETEAGRFEIIHSGGAGAMQAFHPRMSLDDILKVMAWIDTFRED